MEHIAVSKLDLSHLATLELQFGVSTSSFALYSLNGELLADGPTHVRMGRTALMELAMPWARSVAAARGLGLVKSEIKSAGAGSGLRRYVERIESGPVVWLD